LASRALISTPLPLKLDWAGTQNNLGIALSSLGDRENGTAKLEEAVVAYREALKERTRERVPLAWAASFGSEGIVLMILAERRKDFTMAETALRQMAAGSLRRIALHVDEAAKFCISSVTACAASIMGKGPGPDMTFACAFGTKLVTASIHGVVMPSCRGTRLSSVLMRLIAAPVPAR
jgi:hypothetical protein